MPDSVGNSDTFDGPSTGGTPFGFPQVRAAVLAEIGTHAILDAGPGGYRDSERRLAYPLASSTGPGDLVIADRGFWSVEFVHAFTTSGAHGPTWMPTGSPTSAVSGSPAQRTVPARRKHRGAGRPVPRAQPP
ncbi:hypothetical protein [Streptomyces sp. NBRC 109706]|uniref:hypothetical protein n=1 Tax=Streptomyces sp. NBRC 109706 TaxID=1550035 RepID=UPI0007865AE1|nr:hypothetical protein [Streptomyces sp. NBRC 109706]